MLNVLNRMLRNEFECWNNSIAQSHHHSSLNWMTVLQTCCIFCEFERHKFRFEWCQCKIECLENEIEWQIGWAWPKSSKLNAHKMNLVDKITKLTGKTYNNSYIYIAHISIQKGRSRTFKLILRRFQVVFWCLEWECCTFWKIAEIHLNPPILYYGFKKSLGKPMGKFCSYLAQWCTFFIWINLPKVNGHWTIYKNDIFQQ